MRRVAGDSPGRIATALALSTITGPNEAYVMSLRFPFEMASWEILPPGGRAAVARDLASLLAISGDAESVRQMLADKPVELRKSLRDALERTYGVDAAMMGKIGLADLPEQPARTQ
jgi:hypothetical protein